MYVAIISLSRHFLGSATSQLEIELRCLKTQNSKIQLLIKTQLLGSLTQKFNSEKSTPQLGMVLLLSRYELPSRVLVYNYSVKDDFRVFSRQRCNLKCAIELI